MLSSHLLLLSPANLLINCFIGGAAFVLIHLGGVVEDKWIGGYEVWEGGSRGVRFLCAFCRIRTNWLGVGCPCLGLGVEYKKKWWQIWYVYIICYLFTLGLVNSGASSVLKQTKKTLNTNFNFVCIGITAGFFLANMTARWKLDLRIHPKYPIFL